MPTATRPATSAAASAPVRRHGTGCSSAASRARENDAASDQRFCGDHARARLSTGSMAVGTPDQSASCGSASNDQRRPVRHSYNTTPTAYTSVAGPTGFPLACSGGI